MLVVESRNDARIGVMRALNRHLQRGSTPTGKKPTEKNDHVICPVGQITGNGGETREGGAP
jgi:hypothetical protein